MKFDKDILQISQEAVEWRKQLHQHPQTSYEETFCRDFLKEKLTEFGIAHESGIAKTGVVATVEGKTKGEKSIALRADMDALDIFEENEFEHKSKFEGKMHACGHDGHTAMLLGAAKLLSKNRDFSGKVHFIFQPAEEGGAGGDRMVQEGLFEKFPVNSVWGMHNLPGLELGTPGTRTGALMAGVSDFNIIIKGQGGHAALPHQSKDPVLTAAQIVTLLQGIVSRQIDPVEAGVISITGIQGGEVHNVIPDQCEIFGTLRALSPPVKKELIERLERSVKSVCEASGLKAEIFFKENPYPVLINTKEETQIAYQVMEECFGKNSFLVDSPPMMGGEDFAFFLNQKPGCFIFIGNGAPGKKGSAGLHTSKYDFNDELIPYGIQYWKGLVKNQLR